MSIDVYQQIVNALAHEVAQRVQPQKEWLSLRSIASEHADISERKLRAFLGHATHPLPARLVGGKWLVSRAEFDEWVRQFPKAGEDLDQLVDSVMKDMSDEKM